MALLLLTLHVCSYSATVSVIHIGNPAYNTYVGTQKMVWTNLNLEPGLHSVTVNGSCVYNGGVISTKSNQFEFKVGNKS